jgi:hypothetical protein
MTYTVPDPGPTVVAKVGMGKEALRQQEQCMIIPAGSDKSGTNSAVALLQAENEAARREETALKSGSARCKWTYPSSLMFNSNSVSAKDTAKRAAGTIISLYGRWRRMLTG